MLQRCSIIVGSQAIKRSLKPGSSFDGESLSSSRSTQASRTGKFAQMFGPRNDRIFRIFMPLRSVLYGGMAAQKRGRKCGVFQTQPYACLGLREKWPRSLMLTEKRRFATLNSEFSRPVADSSSAGAANYP